MNSEVSFFAGGVISLLRKQIQKYQFVIPVFLLQLFLLFLGENRLQKKPEKEHLQAEYYSLEFFFRTADFI